MIRNCNHVLKVIYSKMLLHVRGNTRKIHFRRYTMEEQKEQTREEMEREALEIIKLLSDEKIVIIMEEVRK